MERTFYNVGHGAFYVEDFGNNGPLVIYDCGSSSPGKRHIESVIEKRLKEREVDFVFISHLHYDHICGLEYLLKNFTVHKIFLPLLTESERVLLFAAQKLRRNTNSFIENLILHPRETIREHRGETEIVGVRPINDHSDSPFDREPIDSAYVEPISEVSDTQSGIPINIPNDFHSLNNVWEYVPFNYRYSDRHDRVVAELLKMNRTASSLIIDLCSSDSQKQVLALSVIKDAFKKARIGAGFNSHTMTVFSGCRSMSVLQHVGNCGYQRLVCSSGSSTASALSGCMYTGDFEARDDDAWREFRNAYAAYLPYVGVFQIPHHGSKHNYRTDFRNMGVNFVISANGRYSLPSESTIIDLMQSGHFPFVVTGEDASIVSFKI